MKILIVNATDTLGGAARAAYRLYKGLESIGVDSYMLVQSKVSDDPKVICADDRFGQFLSTLRPRIDNIPIKLYRRKENIPFSSGILPFSCVLDKIADIRPDIVHLHWINNGMLPISDLARIKIPIVWSLHDMWGFTGGCHYDNYCGKYRDICAMCPVLRSTRESDLSRLLFNAKAKAYKQISNLTVVGLSAWLTECAKGSSLFSARHIINIPNMIDCELFSPINRELARGLMGLPVDRKYILCGADSLGDYLKGFSNLVEALNRIAIPNTELLVFGSTHHPARESIRLPVRFMGRFRDDIALRLLYSAADVVVLPSLQENLSNIVMESLACGSPVVAFNVGGNKDMIESGANGYLGDPSRSPASLADGLNFVLNHNNPVELRVAARTSILSKFEISIVAPKYKTLYEEIIAKKGSLTSFGGSCGI